MTGSKGWHIERVREQWRNIFYCRAYPFTQFLKHATRFSLDYRFRKGRASPPLSISLMVTLRCDLKCNMCKLVELLNVGELDMPLSTISKVAKELSRAQPLIMLSGGEPFLRKDIYEVIKVINGEGLECGIFTNGISFNRKKIDELIASNLRVRFIAFSLLGPPDIHDRIAGRKGAFSALEDHLKYFLGRRNKTICFISSTVSEDNVNRLEDIVILGKKWGVDFVRLVHPCFLTDRDLKRSKEIMRNLFPGEEIREITFHYNLEGKEGFFHKNAMALLGKYPGFVYFTPSISAEEIPLWYSEDYGIRRKCYFCWNGSFIYPNGDVCPCESFYYRLGNVNESSFYEIWNNDRYCRFRSILKKTILPGCARCCKL